MNRNKKYSRFIFWGLVLISIIFLLFPIGHFVGSAKAVLAYVFLPSVKSVDKTIKYATGIPEKTLFLINSAQKNRELTALLKEAQLSTLQLNAVLADNNRIRKLLDLKANIKWQGLWASVMARETSNWYSTIWINKGAHQGIKIADTALADADGKLALIGKIVHVEKGASQILLITDIMSAVHCYHQIGGWEGLLQGGNKGELKLNYVSLSADIAQDDDILTSPISSVFPGNILIGKISKIYPKREYMTYLTADVKSAVKISALKEVFVITEK